jgi:hypothetical protein
LEKTAMNELKVTAPEELFEFPAHAALVNNITCGSFPMFFKERLREARELQSQIPEGPPAWVTAYRYMVQCEVAHAVLLRSAWIRPLEDLGVADARPLQVRVLVDEEVVLEQGIDRHVHPAPVHRNCFCNGWGERGVDCVCRAAPLDAGDRRLLFQATRIELLNAPSFTSFPENPYGIFAPNGTPIEIQLRKVGSPPIEFRAAVGITAALYVSRWPQAEGPK